MTVTIIVRNWTAPSGPSSTSKPRSSCAKLGVGADSAPSSSWNTSIALRRHVNKMSAVTFSRHKTCTCFL